MDKTYEFYMWDDYGYYPEKEIKVLCLMSLVQIENDNVLRMHNQLRDLRREIVRQESHNNPGMCSRLWNQEEASDVLEGLMGTEKVEVLSLHSNGKTFENYRFTKLSNLRYLQVDGAKLVGDFKHHLLRLRWLHWTYCPLHFKATNFQMKKLVILNLSNSHCITGSWKGWSQIKMAKMLKVLNISCTKIRKLPDEIWVLEKLEVIDASRCYYLAGSISSCIGRLTSLRQLSFYRTKIQNLPTSICNLSCLQNLDLGQSDDLQALPKLPSSLEILNVTSLKVRNLRATPNVGNLVNLQELRFSWCSKKLVEIPRNIEKLFKLQVLMLSYANIRTLPKEIGALSQLKILSIQSCHDLQFILGLPSSLVEFYLENCTSLEILSDLSNLKVLLKLMLRSCPKLTEIQGLRKLVSLTSLGIYTCVNLKEVQGLGNLESLTSLVISSCNKLYELDLLQQSVSLASSKMSEYKHLENKSDRCNLNKLKRIQLFGCMNLNKIQGVDRLVSLEYLSLWFCISLVRLPNLSHLKILRHLLLVGCTGLREIEGLEALKGSLEELDVALCTSLEQVSPYSDD